jgi:hypothetical protein
MIMAGVAMGWFLVGFSSCSGNIELLLACCLVALIMNDFKENFYLTDSGLRLPEESAHE